MRMSDWSSDVCSPDLANGIDRQASLFGDLAGDALCLRRRLTIADFRCSSLRHLNFDRRPSLKQFGVSPDLHVTLEIGRESCRERVSQYWSISVVGVSIQKK